MDINSYQSQEKELKVLQHISLSKQVYKAQNIKSQQFYAIKAIKQCGLDAENNQQGIDISIRENSEIITPENTYIGKFDHQNVISYYGQFDINEYKCLIIDYCEGTLHNYFSQNEYHLDEDQIKLIMFQIINGLTYLHEKKIIHRDLNINNILLKDGVWKLADFGFSIQSDKPQNLILGTSGYIAPEMFDPKGYDKKVDIFSLGCIFYQLLHGRLPYPNSTLDDYKRSILSGQEPQYDDNIDFQLFNLIYEMLKFDPKERINLLDIQMDIFDNLQNYDFKIRKVFNYEEFDQEQYQIKIISQIENYKPPNKKINLGHLIYNKFNKDKIKITKCKRVMLSQYTNHQRPTLENKKVLNILSTSDRILIEIKSYILKKQSIDDQFQFTFRGGFQIEQLQNKQLVELNFQLIYIMIQYDEVYKTKIGKTMHQYRFDQFLSSGAFGAVFKGTNLIDGNNVAIKLVTVESFDDSGGVVGELLVNEINIMKEIENDNVVRFLDYFQSKKFAYIIMEYCDGGTLLDYWMRNNEKIPPFEALKIMKQILNGMRGLHEKFVMHRDLKLANILIHEDVIKIADLGFSCRLQDENDLQKLSLGTQGLMAPEVVACEFYGLEADVFSVGAIFYQLIYGALPFDDQNNDAFLHDIRNRKPTFIKIDPNYDDLLQDIISKMLEYERFKRISFAQIYDHKIMKLEAPRGSLIDKGQVKLNNIDFTKSINFYKQNDKDKSKFGVLKSDGKLPVLNLDLDDEEDFKQAVQQQQLNQIAANQQKINEPNDQSTNKDNSLFKRKPQKLDSGLAFQENYIQTPQGNSEGEKRRAIEEGCKRYLDFYNYIQTLIKLSEDMQLVQYKNVYPIMYPRLQLQKLIYFKQYDLLDDIRKKQNMFSLQFIEQILETQEMKYIFERIFKEVVDSKDIYCQNQYQDLKQNISNCQKYIDEKLMSSAKISCDQNFYQNFKISMKYLRDYLYNEENDHVKDYDQMLRIILNITNLLNLSDIEFKQLYGRVKTMDINSLTKEVTSAIQRESI